MKVIAKVIRRRKDILHRGQWAVSERANDALFLCPLGFQRKFLENRL
jgi:hypothetical protein